MSDYEKNIKNFCETYKQNAKINNVNSYLCIYQINNILSGIAFYVYNGEIAFYKKLMLLEDNDKISKYFDKRYKLKNENLEEVLKIYLTWVNFSKNFEDGVITILPEDIKHFFSLFKIKKQDFSYTLPLTAQSVS